MTLSDARRWMALLIMSAPASPVLETPPSDHEEPIITERTSAPGDRSAHETRDFRACRGPACVCDRARTPRARTHGRAVCSQAPTPRSLSLRPARALEWVLHVVQR